MDKFPSKLSLFGWGGRKRLITNEHFEVRAWEQSAQPLLWSHVHTSDIQWKYVSQCRTVDTLQVSTQTDEEY